MSRLVWSLADPGVVAWAEATDGNTMFVSSVTVLELEYGVRLLERRDAVQGAVMRRWLDEGVMRAFADHVLPVDEAIARHAGRLRAEMPRQVPDALIAATAHVHRMTVITRNVRDFEAMGVRVLNPWAA